MKNSLFKKIALFIVNTKDSLYNIGAPKGKPVSIDPASPDLVKVGNMWLKKLQSSMPKLEINYIGSSALGLPGQKDIDFLIACDQLEFKNYQPKLNKFFGKPTKVSKAFIEWRYEYNGITIETAIIDPKFGRYKDYIAAYNLLKNNPKHLLEYKELKLSANGKPSKEYDALKDRFFNKIYIGAGDMRQKILNSIKNVVNTAIYILLYILILPLILNTLILGTDKTLSFWNIVGLMATLTLTYKKVAEYLEPLKQYLSVRLEKLQQKHTRLFNTDTLLILASTIISVAALWTAYALGQANLSNYDAIARLNIARKVFDSLTPGIAQLGGIWLPFPQVLFMPFIGNDFLWHSGFAGAISSMASFILSSLFLYKTVYLISNSKRGGILAWLIYVTNINILFLQTMAMSESFFLLTVVMIIYFLTKWVKSKNILDLIYTGFFVILTTLTRYEGYALFGSATLTVGIITLLVNGKPNYKRFEGTLILFMTFAGFGIFVWALYSLLIFKDPIYWLNLYSGNKQIIALDPTEVREVVKNVTVVTKRITIFNALETYGSAMVYMNGILLSILAAFGFVFLVIKSGWDIFKKRLDILIVPMLVVTICILLFLIVGYTKGLIPNIETPFLTLENLFNKKANLGSSSNIRYGIIVLPLIALIVGLVYSKSKLFTTTVIFLLAFQIYALTHTPLFLTFSIPAKDRYQPSGAALWFKSNYDNGLILTSANRHENFIFQTGLPYKNFVYEGSQEIWRQSLNDPRKYAKWVVLDTADNGDAVTTLMSDKSILENSYTVVYKELNLLVYKIK